MLKYFLIPVLCILASSKVLIQSKFAKDCTKTPGDAVLFNGIIFVFSAIIALSSLQNSFDVPLCIFASIFGLFSVVFQVFYIHAFLNGPVSITVLIVSASMLIPIVFSAVTYHETVTVTGVIGILITIVVFWLNTERTKGEKYKSKWLIFTLIAVIANSVNVITQKVFAKSYPQGSPQSFVAVAYLVAAVLSLLVYAFFKLKGKGCTYKLKPAVFLTAGSVGVILSVYQLLNTYANSVIDGAVLYPVYNGGVSVLTTVSSTILFKERLTVKQRISVVLGIIAIILINIR